MSGVYLVLCHSCSYSQGFKFGLGTRFPHLHQVLSLINQEKRFRIINALIRHRASKSSFGYQAFHCPECSNLSNGLWISIEQDTELVYETQFHCRKCGDQMEPVPEPEYIKALPCPECECSSLDPIMLMTWN